MESDEDERVALLDEIAEQLEAALAHPDEKEGHAAVPDWMRLVLTLLETAPELVYDALELLAMLLTACQALQNPYAQHAIDIALEPKSIGVILQSLVRSLQKSPKNQDGDLLAEQPERFELACSIGCTIIYCAQHEEQMNHLVEAWHRNSPELADLLERVPRAMSSLPKRTRVQASCLLCFTAEGGCVDEHQFVNAIPMYETLQRFTASRDQSAVRSWMNDSWETRWHLFDCSSLTAITRALGLPHQSPNTIMAILSGISIPQIEADDMEQSNGSMTRFLASLDLDNVCDLRHGVDVTLVKNGCVHPEYAGSNAVIRLPEIMQAFGAGYTIGIRGVHARSLAVSKLCAALQRDLQQYANANIYCTFLPVDGNYRYVGLIALDILHWTGTPSDQQGFNLHVDDHCVFVVQVKGAKTWHIRPPALDLPVLYDDTEAFLSTHDSGTDSGTPVRLKPGDVLYLPRGTPHYATTTGLSEDSIHITIGIEIDQSLTKWSLVEALLSKAYKESDTNHSAEGLTTMLNALYESAESNAECRRCMRAGLMAWHLESASAFETQAMYLLNALKMNCSPSLEANDLTQRCLHAISQEKHYGESVRMDLLASRHRFLASRELIARGFAQLQDALGSFSFSSEE